MMSRLSRRLSVHVLISCSFSVCTDLSWATTRSWALRVPRKNVDQADGESGEQHAEYQVPKQAVPDGTRGETEAFHDGEDSLVAQVTERPGLNCMVNPGRSAS